MTSSNISIEVDAEAARAFESASDEQKQKLQMLLNLRLRELVAQPPRSLQQIMDEIGAEAERRGATPQMVESLINGS